MAKITFMGAGSTVFAKNVLGDCICSEPLKGSTLALYDIDSERLADSVGMLENLNRNLHGGMTIEGYLGISNRRAALDRANYVVNAIQVGGYKPSTVIDFEIPKKYGLRQTIADTLGIGGIFRTLRTLPVMLDFAHDMEAVCPEAWLLNYTNPMAMHMLAIQRATSVRAVGLCHGVVNTAITMRMLVAMKDIPESEIAAHFRRPYNSPERTAEWKRWWELGRDEHLSYSCAGINHMAAFLRFESGGRDLYPDLKQLLDLPYFNSLEPVRFDLLRWLGYFMTETSSHSAEYLPYFLKNDAEIASRSLRVAGYLEAVGLLAQEIEGLDRALQSGSPVVPEDYSLSVEYASRIINAIVTGKPFVFNGNVQNRGGALISNLPGDACVEVPCVADSAGVTPTVIGDLPPQMAAMIRTNINVQDLAVRGILENSKDFLYQAAMLDPNTASSLTLSQIKALMDAMFEAHGGNLSPDLRFRGTCHFE